MERLTESLFRPISRRTLSAVVALGVLFAAAVLGRLASLYWLLLFLMGGGTLVLLKAPNLGLLAVVAAALVVPLEFSTGTEVKLNLATLLVPALFALWLLQGIRARSFHWMHSSVNRPLGLFLMAGLLSLLIGNATWDPAVPKSGSFLLVQLAQWAIFVIAAMAFWLTANMREPKVWLPRLTWAFLMLGGGLMLLWMLPGMGGRIIGRFATFAFIRAPFWMLMAAVAGGQLLFNTALSNLSRVVLGGLLVGVISLTFFRFRGSSSTWMGVGVALAVLGWLRWPKLRWPVLVLVVSLAVFGGLFSSVYEFAGGDEDWTRTGGSRLALIERVLSVTLRNPITGLGPASYRPYANVEPLKYLKAVYFNPLINSHNNWVDLFAHTGLLGLGLFIWFAITLGLLGWRLSRQYPDGFLGGYVATVVAAWVASLVLMLFADWILPFVYNVGFSGFQASVLVWLFLGGIVAVEWIDKKGGRYA